MIPTGTGIGLGAGTGFQMPAMMLSGNYKWRCNVANYTDRCVNLKAHLHPKALIRGDFSVGLNTFTVAATNGNTLVGGTLDVTGLVNPNDTTNSTNTTSGALVVDGGLGIGSNPNVGGDLSVNGPNRTRK